MSDRVPRIGPLAVWAAVFLGGCAGPGDRAKQYELKDDYHLAYEEHLVAVGLNPDNTNAVAGLRRTAAKAAQHWQEQGFVEAENGSWVLAAKCHLKALQIRPDLAASVAWLRETSRQRPEDIEQAYESLASGGMSGELLAMATEAAARSPDEVDAAQGPDGTDVARPPKKAPPAKTSKSGPVAVASKTPKVPAKPIDPYAQRPGIRREPGTGDGDFIVVVRVSRDDHRFPKKAHLANGLSVKVKDTDKSPLDADMEVYLGRKRIGKFKNLRENTIIGVLDEDGQPCEIVIMNIYDQLETVTVGFRTH